ncbi:hypothetical protein M885DRAFT_534830 [Pelagophyceae sp. CCMP2097]|nr:hypothetical protein M885DRAFT_534830 [Pelagophyceae sp. CCMP2097]
MGGAASCASRERRTRGAALKRDANAPPSGIAASPPCKPRPTSPARGVPKIAAADRALYAQALDETPKAGGAFKYYCPLCMRYFRRVFRSACCGHYCCVGCAVAVLEVHAANMRSDDVRACKDPIRCPGCNGPRLIFEQVPYNDPVRSYDDDPGVIPFDAADSPVRAGDSFATLRRKMLAYEDSGSNADNVRRLFAADDDGSRCGATSDAPPLVEDEKHDSFPSFDSGAAPDSGASHAPDAAPAAAPPDRPRDVVHYCVTPTAAHESDAFVRGFVSSILTDI